ncbi:MAG: helix-turn-helix transcriptional regulator [Tissierellia bacterium]|nr:helix-turn-helix transcriptional regulator [Tissierellia bacterium]
MNQRIKQLRKTLGLSGEKFGERLGVQRAAISNIENGNRNITDQMFKFICREFNVNPQWLKYGEGEMFNKDEKSILDSLVDQHHLKGIDIKLLESFIKLDPDKRKVITDYLSDTFKD